MEFRIKSLEELGELAKGISSRMRLGDVFALRGDLGAGKTSLVGAILESLDYPEVVSSPTFSLANVYDTEPRINHLDLYRLEHEEEVESFEYELYFYPEDSITFIEWPDRAKSYLPRKLIEVSIRMDGKDRIVSIDDDFVERNDRDENFSD